MVSFFLSEKYGLSSSELSKFYLLFTFNYTCQVIPACLSTPIHLSVSVFSKFTPSNFQLLYTLQFKLSDEHIVLIDIMNIIHNLRIYFIKQSV